MFEKLKEKWGIKRNIDIVLIIVCFSLAGSSVVFVKGYYFQFLGFTETTPFWLKTIAYLLFIFPAYQLMLLGYGLVLGQFRFFLAKEKALLGRIGKMFGNGK
jgi:uncharacterized membrane protein